MLGVGAVQAFAGAATVGITTDEPTQLSRTQGWIDDGWFLPVGLLEGGEPLDIPSANPYAYGSAFASIAHSANRLAGNESGDEVSTEKDAWTVRHLVTALIGVITAGLVGFAVWRLTRSARFALWAAAALLAIPIWLGMSFFNPKDIPAAAGYTMFTVGLVAALPMTGLLAAGARRRGVAVAALVAVGLFLGVGTRLALWAPFLASIVTFAVLAWFRTREGAQVRSHAGAYVGVGLIVGVSAIAWSYPAAFSEPLDLLSRSVSSAAEFPYSGLTLTAGELLTEDPPWWYLPAWAFASLPVLLLLLAVAGAGSAVRSMVRSVGGGPARFRSLTQRPDLAIVLVIQQATLLPIASVVYGPNMYSGLRQHLYMIPAVAILSGVGAHRIWQRAIRDRASVWQRRAVAGVLSAALILPVVEQTLLFPYNYTYVNPIAGIGGVNGRWETDFWGASLREALSRLPADAAPLCSLGRQLGSQSGDAEIVECASAPYFAPYLDEQDGAEAQSGESIVMITKRAGNLIPAGCRSYQDVTRWSRGEEVIMAYVVSCSPGEGPDSPEPP